MLLTHYYAIAVAAALLTAAWLFKPEARTALTTLGAFLAWGLVALLGGATQVYADAGAMINETQTGNEDYVVVPQGEQLVAAPVPDELRMFAVMWALLSALALLLYVWGVYPPDDEQPAEAGANTRQ